MNDNKAPILVFFIFIITGFIIEAFLPAILQLTNLAIQSANGDFLVVGLLRVIPVIFVVWIVLLKVKEI